ncbi:hypothetical protein JXO59_00805 [candidate division KSB1 bacterium]|nr:hypothetical protein [candidate division KSB1 bacterium]
MKNLLIAFLMVLSVCPFLSAQSKILFGIHNGIALPTLTYHHHDSEEFGFEFNDSHKIGPEVGAVIKMASIDPWIYTALGINAMSFVGKKAFIDDSTSVRGEPLSVITTFLGIQIGKQVGPYVQPAISASWFDGYPRYGYDIGIGFLQSLGMNKAKLDLNLTYSFLNVLNKEADEQKRNVLRISLGILY